MLKGRSHQNVITVRDLQNGKQMVRVRADVVVIPHSSRVRSKAANTASMTESFANGSEADVPDLVWLSDLYLLLRHLHKANMAKTRFSRLI